MNEPDRFAAFLRVVIGRSGPVAPDTATWDQWMFTARFQRVVPLLYQLVDTVPTDLTDGQRQDIVRSQEAVLARCVQLEHHLIVAVGLLAEQGIRSAVLKGGATAHLDYPDPSWREVSDVDLLIDPADRARALELLGREGWIQGYALPKGHEAFTHAVTLVKDQMELDLHQRVARRAIGLRIPTRELLDRAVPFDIAGRDVRALNDVDRLIHSSLHMVTAHYSDLPFSSVADVLLAAERRPGLAYEVLAQAERWRVRPLVERAVNDAYAIAKLDVDPRWTAAMSRPIRRRDRLVEHAYLSGARRPVLKELAYLRLLEGWGNRWRYACGYFATDPDYVAQHGRSGARAQARYVLAKLGLRRP